MKEELEELSLLSEESAKNVKVMVGNGITHMKLKGCLISHVGDTRFSHPQVVVYHREYDKNNRRDKTRQEYHIVKKNHIWL